MSDESPTIHHDTKRLLDKRYGRREQRMKIERDENGAWPTWAVEAILEELNPLKDRVADDVLNHLERFDEEMTRKLSNDG